MATLKIKKGDTVRVIAGKDNGKEGKVVSIDRKNGRVLVEGINMVTKHMKPSAANQNGGIVQKEAPIDISNVMYLHKGNRQELVLSSKMIKRFVLQNQQGKLSINSKEGGLNA